MSINYAFDIGLTKNEAYALLVLIKKQFESTTLVTLDNKEKTEVSLYNLRDRIRRRIVDMEDVRK